MGSKANRQLIERYYDALTSGDHKTFAALHSEDAKFNLIGKTPVSGHFRGRDNFLKNVAARVSRSLVPGHYKFAEKWRIMAADENCVVAIMQGGGKAKNGLWYHQTYCQVFTIENNMIIEVHEFFDTALAEAALFDNHLQNPQLEPEAPFSF
jgi:ketosteroid isomerase-like protein